MIINFYIYSPSVNREGGVEVRATSPTTSKQGEVPHMPQLDTERSLEDQRTIPLAGIAGKYF